MARRKHMRAKRRPLLQRSAMHALKILVREHPRAAWSAATAGAGYAVSSVAEDASDAVREAAGRTRETLVERAPVRRQFSKGECEDMLSAMTPRQRKAFAALARNREG